MPPPPGVVVSSKKDRRRARDRKDGTGSTRLQPAPGDTASRRSLPVFKPQAKVVGPVLTSTRANIRQLRAESGEQKQTWRLLARAEQMVQAGRPASAK